MRARVVASARRRPTAAPLSLDSPSLSPPSRYFPGEFREAYPDGVPIECVDRRGKDGPPSIVAFTGAGHALGRVATLESVTSGGGGGGGGGAGVEALLAKLPSKVMSNGRVVDVRADIAARLGAAPAPAPAAAPAAEDDAADADDGAPRTSLQVRCPDGSRMVLKLKYDATVGDLRARIRAAYRPAGGDGAAPYELRTAYPNRAYEDEAKTLEEEGLTPSATLMLKA